MKWLAVKNYYIDLDKVRYIEHRLDEITFFFEKNDTLRLKVERELTQDDLGQLIRKLDEKLPLDIKVYTV